MLNVLYLPFASSVAVYREICKRNSIDGKQSTQKPSKLSKITFLWQKDDSLSY